MFCGWMCGWKYLENRVFVKMMMLLVVDIGEFFFIKFWVNKMEKEDKLLGYE